MSNAARVHPTAIVDRAAVLGAGVVVGPFALLEGDITLGDNVHVGPYCHLLGKLTVGAGTSFGTGCVIGERPQHTGYKGEPTAIEIGEANTFREQVTVHRAMPVPTGRGVTTVGHRNLFMVNSHIAHDCLVGDDCIFANGAVVGGHATLGDRVLLSGNSAVHQHCRVGRLALLGGTSAISQDLPPFWICQGGINMLHGVNVIGMRRAGMAREEVVAARQCYKFLNRSGLIIPHALERIEAEFGDVPAARELVAFVRATKRGVCVGHQVTHDPSHDTT